ncbi:MAG: hypothetical protein LBB68_06390 [Treponema sp.]|jgi:hypothetical protein|nr:hypothetical protein [Treponema sp.]
MPYFYVRASVIVPPEMASSVTGIAAAAIGFGSFLSSFGRIGPMPGKPDYAA